MRTTTATGWAGILLATGVAVGAQAGELRRLPADYVFPQGDGSPAAVTFRHDSHVDARRPDCVACHPATFSLLTQGKATGLRALKHEEMEKGRACGACHGKQAFGLESCDTCHRG